MKTGKRPFVLGVILCLAMLLLFSSIAAAQGSR